MELNEKQKQAIDIAVERYREGCKYTVISGWAGTGKSTVVRYIIAALQQFGVNPEEDVCYCAFTGKACTVLQQKGNKNVSTLHRLLYEYRPKPDGTFFKKRVEFIDYKVIVVDEVSMVAKELVEELHKHYNLHIIYLGDDFQLPPIDPKTDNHLLDKPHIRLTQIMRQAEGNEIIDLTTAIREGKKIQPFCGNEVKVLRNNELNQGMLAWADIILCATNKKRQTMNNEVRQLLGYSGPPQVGDKVICKRNYWDIASENGDALVNGTIGYLRNPFDTFFRVPYWASPNQREFSVDYMIADFATENGDMFNHLEIDKKMIMTEQPCLDWKVSYKLAKSKQNFPNPMEFYYGYAITTHAAQGSQWDKVLVLEEWFPKVGEEHARWLYTACTRGIQKLVLVMKE